MYRNVNAFVLMMLCWTGTSAQVTKCTDPKTGEVSYTDGKCETGRNSKQVSTAGNIVSPIRLPAAEEPVPAVAERGRLESPDNLMHTHGCKTALRNLETARSIRTRGREESIAQSREQVLRVCGHAPPQESFTEAPRKAVFHVIGVCNTARSVVTCHSQDGRETYTGRGTEFMRGSDGHMCTSVMSPLGRAMDCR